MLHWRPPRPNLISPSIRGAGGVDQARGSPRAWLPQLRRCGSPLSVQRRSIARSFSRDDVQPIVLAPEQTARAKLLLELWVGNGRLPDIVEAGILREMHARLKALLERMAKDLNARLDLVSAIP